MQVNAITTGMTRREQLAAIAEALAGYSPEQVAKALEAIEDGAVQPIPCRYNDQYEVVSSDGRRTYRTTTSGWCSCQASAKLRRCYHAAAVEVLDIVARNAASDALKRCAMRLGLGLHLWAQGNYKLDAWLSKNGGTATD